MAINSINTAKSKFKGFFVATLVATFRKFLERAVAVAIRPTVFAPPRLSIPMRVAAI
jgi:hypothetical protein